MFRRRNADFFSEKKEKLEVPEVVLWGDDGWLEILKREMGLISMKIPLKFYNPDSV